MSDKCPFCGAVKEWNEILGKRVAGFKCGSMPDHDCPTYRQSRQCIETELAALKALVQEIDQVKLGGTFRGYYNDIQAILERPEVRAIVEGE